MNVDGAYKILTKYQLLNFNDGLERVFTIQERYEKFRHSISKPNEIGLARRVREVLDACKTIENSIQIESEELLKARFNLGNGKYSQEFKRILDEEDKRIIAQVSKPLPPAPHIDNN